MNRPGEIHVVIPARNEELLIGRCLSALTAARSALYSRRPDIRVRATVVLNGCADATSAAVDRAPGIEGIEVVAPTVGAARAAGVDHAQRVAGDPSSLWVACTDADSMVPESWLWAQVLSAQEGYAARTGTVLPDLASTDPVLHRRWLARHNMEPGHPHIHGANLGFSIPAYRQVGGFEDRVSGEDVGLVDRMRAAGLPVMAAGGDPVITSGRRTSRLRGGFADYLGDLADAELIR